MAKPDTKDYIKRMKAARDVKVREHLAQYAPLWMIEERDDPEKDSLYFKVVFYHPDYQWVSRLYWYDAFTDVLYQRGQKLVDEETAVEIQAEPPYMEDQASNSMLSYGG